MAKAKYTYNESRKEWYTLVYDGTLTASGAKHRKLSRNQGQRGQAQTVR